MTAFLTPPQQIKDFKQIIIEKNVINEEKTLK